MVKIAHLYYDILNLYGEDGNIKALEHALNTINVDYKLDKLTLNDIIDFSSYDFIYIGSGTENNLKIALEDIKRFEAGIKEYIDQNKVMLCTGNSISIFGKYIRNLDNSKIECLNIFNYHVKETKLRVVADVMFTLSGSKKLIGFYNTKYTVVEELVKNYNNIFEIKKSIGYEFENKSDGINKNNFYGTNIIGPIMVRNPEFLRFILSRILEETNIVLSDSTPALDFDFENKAREEFIKNYYKNKKNKKIH